MDWTPTPLSMASAVHLTVGAVGGCTSDFILLDCRRWLRFLARRCVAHAIEPGALAIAGCPRRFRELWM